MASFAGAIPDAEFAFTGNQLNRDCNAAVRIGVNNTGPSDIIGLGESEGGELWVVDANGDTEVAVIRPMVHQPYKIGDNPWGSWPRYADDGFLLTDAFPK